MIEMIEKSESLTKMMKNKKKIWMKEKKKIVTYPWCNYTNIRRCKMFICIGIPKHWRFSLVQIRNVYWLLEFSLWTRGERDIIFLLCWPFHLTQQTRGASHRPQTGLASSSFKSQLASPNFGSQLTAFFENPIPSLQCMTSFTPQSYFLSGLFIMTSVIVTSSPREREHLRSMCVPARALSRIVLSLTKQNNKI